MGLILMDAVAVPTVARSPAAASAAPACSLSSCGTRLRRNRAWKGAASLSLKPQPRRRFCSGSIVCETKEASTGVVDDTSFKKLVIEESEMPVLVDFWAPWCGPCRMLDPVIDSIAEKYKGRIKCYKVNTDECSKTATELGIRSIPTCMIFKQGERLDTVIGCVPETTLTGVIDKYLSS